MAILRFTEEELAGMTPEREARLNVLDEMSDDDIDFSEIPEWTERDWAVSVRVSDYPSAEEARRVATHLCEMRKAGKSDEELEAYKASRIRQAATV